MYPNQAFSSGSYSEMFSGSPLLPHNNYSGSVGGPTMADPACNSFAGDSHLVPRTQIGIVDTEQNAQCQGLSLSLGTLMTPAVSVPPFQYQYHANAGFSSLMNEANLHKELRSAECMESVSSGEFHDSGKREGLYNPNPSSVCLKDVHSDPCLQGSQGFSNTVMNTQYLKAAQELLDEIVSVKKALKQPGMENKEKLRDIGLDGSKDSDGKSTSQSMQVSSGPNSSNANPLPELSPGERQNLLEKKTKLLAMLDEVDKRYRQYCHQMQIVVSSFDMVAGCGAAEPYTTLALRTISRHFRCLRDAVSGQIQVCQRSLGEQEGIPRLRYVDQQLRQQKALQHLGVMRQAWRPQRGLPENSVSILRAWLFEHFLHPYPKDSEKIMLARQTGLTRNQVANWFINARVRLWKPMVEEMYKEEFGDSEMSCNIPSEIMLKGNKRDDAEASDNNKGEESHDNLITVDSVHQQGQFHGLKPEHASSSTAELDRGIHNSVHGENWMDSGARKMQSNQRFTMNNNDNNNNSFYSCAPIPTNQNGDGSSIIDSTTNAPATYDLSELGNFTVGGHVSLALELRNCESDGFDISDDAIHKRRNNNNNQALASSSSSPEADDLLGYHFTDSGKQQHRFSNPHLLHEFVV